MFVKTDALNFKNFFTRISIPYTDTHAGLYFLIQKQQPICKYVYLHYEFTDRDAETVPGSKLYFG